MKHRRLLALWLVIALCGAVMLAAMSWLTRGALASEAERLTAQRDRAVAEARADLEERTRLALWRMDALGAAIVLRENLVRVEQYRDLPKAGLPPAPEVLLRFEILDEPRPVTSETLAPDAQVRAVAGERLERLGRLLAETNPMPCCASRCRPTSSARTRTTNKPGTSPNALSAPGWWGKPCNRRHKPTQLPWNPRPNQGAAANRKWQAVCNAGPRPLARLRTSHPWRLSRTAPECRTAPHRGQRPCAANPPPAPRCAARPRPRPMGRRPPMIPHGKRSKRPQR